MKRLFLLITALVVISAITIFFSFTLQPEPVEAPVVEVVEIHRLTSAEYKVAAQPYLDLVASADPRVALDELERALVTDRSLLLSCHTLVHQIGHAAYEKYNDFDQALSYTNETCNSGYLHGVIESHFDLIPDPLEDLESICSGYDYGRCHHGVGHGLMFYTSNELYESLEMCDSYEDLEARVFCAQGVYMENFNSDQKLHPSEYLDAENPFYPCDVTTARYRTDCYYYAPTYFLYLNDNDYAAALDWCETAPTSYREACVRGTGSMIMKHHMHDVKTGEALCSDALPHRVASCIDGMVGLYLNHYDSVEIGGLLCEVLDRPNNATCMASVARREYLFVD